MLGAQNNNTANSRNKESALKQDSIANAKKNKVKLSSNQSFRVDSDGVMVYTYDPRQKRIDPVEDEEPQELITVENAPVKEIIKTIDNPIVADQPPVLAKKEETAQVASTPEEAAPNILIKSLKEPETELVAEVEEAEVPLISEIMKAVAEEAVIKDEVETTAPEEVVLSAPEEAETELVAEIEKTEALPISENVEIIVKEASEVEDIATEVVPVDIAEVAQTESAPEETIIAELASPEEVVEAEPIVSVPEEVVLDAPIETELVAEIEKPEALPISENVEIIVKEAPKEEIVAEIVSVNKTELMAETDDAEPVVPIRKTIVPVNEPEEESGSELRAESQKETVSQIIRKTPVISEVVEDNQAKQTEKDKDTVAAQTPAKDSKKAASKKKKLEPTYKNMEEAALATESLLEKLQKESYKENPSNILGRAGNRRNNSNVSSSGNYESFLDETPEEKAHEPEFEYDGPSYFIDGVQVEKKVVDKLSKSDILSKTFKTKDTTNPYGEIWYVTTKKKSKR
ncbi:hypothetical protein [Dysgonomonas sp. PH5-37]|uniref:hypothetical protein n=1 Tax=Dysgonomonas sp. PH5-37 TaxID=2940648 RepID=UPI002475C84C|nr:hypothetical protein [Dysgonomonas sp. PH5-37]